MFENFCTAFFGSDYVPNDFDLTFALFVLILMIFGLSEVIAAIVSFTRR